MNIRVDFFKVSSGKWKYGGVVDVGEARLWNEGIPQAIVDHQDIIHEGWQEHEEYIVVTNDTPENWNDPEYREFNKAIFFPHEFKGLKRTNGESEK